MEIRRYQIAQFIIEMRIPFACRETAPFRPFVYKSASSADIVVEFELCKAPPENMGELVYISDIHVFRNRSQWCIEHFVAFREKPYAWAVWNDNTPGYMKCYILEEEAGMCQSIPHLFQLMRLEQICMMMDACVLHCSFVKWRGRGILFSAPSGTGKSTQAELWRQLEGAEIINGDRAILRKVDDCWRAFGMPYAGSSQIFRNESSPIGGIIVLRQGNCNEISRLHPAESFRRLYSETLMHSWDQVFQNTIVELLLDLVQNVPVWQLSCLPDAGAVEILKKCLESE